MDDIVFLIMFTSVERLLTKLRINHWPLYTNWSWPKWSVSKSSSNQFLIENSIHIPLILLSLQARKTSSFHQEINQGNWEVNFFWLRITNCSNCNKGSIIDLVNTKLVSNQVLFTFFQLHNTLLIICLFSNKTLFTGIKETSRGSKKFDTWVFWIDTDVLLLHQTKKNEKKKRSIKTLNLIFIMKL